MLANDFSGKLDKISLYVVNNSSSVNIKNKKIDAALYCQQIYLTKVKFTCFNFVDPPVQGESFVFICFHFQFLYF